MSECSTLERRDSFIERGKRVASSRASCTTCSLSSSSARNRGSSPSHLLLASCYCGAAVPTIPVSSALLPSPRASVASSGRLFASASDSTAFADWLPSSSGGGRGGDLSLGFHAGAGRGGVSSLAAELWGSAASRQAAAASLGYGAINAAAAAGDVGMVVVAPGGGSFHHQRAAAAAAAAAAAGASPDDPMFPLVAAAQRALDAKPATPGHAIQFWQQAQAEPEPSAVNGSPGKQKPLAMMEYAGRGRADSGSGSGGGTSCYDCGNQAKKGCAHNRCRTCCNSRGFECDTHVRSTWVPAARRRERQQLGDAGASPPSVVTTTAKKRRLACHTNTGTNSRTSTSNATTPRSFETSSSHHRQDASFRESLPRHVRGPAVFRCVQVTSVDDGQREVAYQAAVTINGHLFRGLLYDLGAEDGRTTASAAAAVQLGSSDLHLGSASAAGPDLYARDAAPLILGGLGYGNVP